MVSMGFFKSTFKCKWYANNAGTPLFHYSFQSGFSYIWQTIEALVFVLDIKMFTAAIPVCTKFDNMLSTCDTFKVFFSLFLK